MGAEQAKARDLKVTELLSAALPPLPPAPPTKVAPPPMAKRSSNRRPCPARPASPARSPTPRSSFRCRDDDARSVIARGPPGRGRDQLTLASLSSCLPSRATDLNADSDSPRADSCHCSSRIISPPRMAKSAQQSGS
jgi:hypothetical protein